MTLRSASDIIKSMITAINASSPQLRIDATRGPFFDLAVRALSVPLAEQSAEIERVAKLSTFAFSENATDTEIASFLRAFAQSGEADGVASGPALFCSSQRPTGSDEFVVQAGDVVSTRDTGGLIFVASETKALDSSNADLYFNATTRRYELPVTVICATSGDVGNIPPFSLKKIVSGAGNFDTVYNLVRFEGGSPAESNAAAFERVKQKLRGIENLSVGGLRSFCQNVDINRIDAVQLVYSSSYPTTFKRLPDGAAIDVIVAGSAKTQAFTESFFATAGQQSFTLSRGPVLGLTSVFVNGTADTAASLSLDQSGAYGRSTRESSVVTLSAPSSVNDVIEITYTYDQLLRDIQTELTGYETAGDDAHDSIYATDILVRYPRDLALRASCYGTVLANKLSVAAEIQSVIADYVANGDGNSSPIGGVRTPKELRELIMSRVPGLGSLSFSAFCKKSLGSIVQVVDVPKNARPVISVSDIEITLT